MIKSCAICGKNFETSFKKLTCSDECRKLRNRLKSKKWYDENPDKVKEMQKRVRVKRKASGKSSEYRRSRRRSKHGYVDRFLERAKEKTPDTDLDREHLYFLMVGDKCNITSVDFKYDSDGSTSWENPYSPSIDRIDSDKGYYKGNVQIVLSTVNFAKSKMTMENFIIVWGDILRQWKALTGVNNE